MNASYESIRRAVTSFFRDGWTVDGAPRTRVAWPNTPFAPPEGAAWVRLTILFSRAGRELITGRRESGTLIEGLIAVQIFTPVGTGDGEAMALLDAAGALWSERRIEILPGREPLVTFVPDPLVSGPVGEWYQVNLHTPFEFLET